MIFPVTSTPSDARLLGSEVIDYLEVVAEKASDNSRRWVVGKQDSTKQRYLPDRGQIVYTTELVLELELQWKPLESEWESTGITVCLQSIDLFRLYEEIEFTVVEDGVQASEVDKVSMEYPRPRAELLELMMIFHRQVDKDYRLIRRR